MRLRISDIRGKVNDLSLLLLFIAILGYMPTSRDRDSYIWLAAVIIFIINTALRGKHVRIDSSILWYSSLSMYGLFSCLWSLNTSRYESFFFLTFLVVFLILICLSTYIESKDDVDHILGILIIAGCIAGLRYCYYTDWSGIFSTGYYMRGTFGGLIDDVTNYNNYTTPLCLVGIIASYYSFVKNKKWCYACFILLMFILIFSGSRKTIVTIPLVTIVFTLCKGDVKEKVKTIGLVALLIFAGWFILNNVQFLSQIRNRLYSLVLGVFGDSGVELDNSTMLRINMIKSAKEVWGKHVLLGVGWNNFRYYNPLGQSTAHNGYIELLASLGILGFLLYYSYYFIKVVNCLICFTRRSGYEWNIFMIGIIISILSLEYGSVLLYSRSGMLLIMIIFMCDSVITSSTKRVKIWR